MGVYACMRPSGALRPLGYVDTRGANSEYGPHAQLLGTPVIGGTYAAGQFETGQDDTLSCLKYESPLDWYRCLPPLETVRVVDARSGRSATLLLPEEFSLSQSFLGPVQVPVLNLPPVPVAVSGAGAVAWIDSRGLVATGLRPHGKKLKGSPQVLDANASGLISLSALTVTWYDVVNGVQVEHSATVPAG